MNLPPPDLPPPSELPPPSAVSPASLPAGSSQEQAPPPAELVANKAAVENDDDSADDPGSLGGMLLDAVTFPWRKDNLYILIPGAILILLLTVATIAPIFGIVPAVLGPAYFAAYYFKVVEAAITQRKGLPEWPGVSNIMEELLQPAVQLLAVYFFSLLPGIVWNLAMGVPWGTKLLAVPLPLAVLGDVYFPFGVLALVIRGSIFEAINPRLFAAILKSLPECLILTLGLYLAKLVLRALPSAAVGNFFIVMLLSTLASMACFIMQARLTGSFYLYRQARFPW